MPITASSDSRRFITLSNSALNPSTALSVTAVQSGTALTFTPADGSPAITLQLPSGWSGISVGSNVTLTINSDLLVGKAVLGSGTAIALAPLSGGNLSAQVLFADIIQLTAGQSYTLSASQASIARIDQGSLGSLSSSGVITVMAPTAYDLSGITLDSGDSIVLTAGVDYTLTASQAAIARVGSAGKAGVLTSTGALRIVAPSATDLSTLSTDSNDTLVLTEGVSYTLSANQVAVAQVGANGTKGNLTTAGTILVKALANGDATLHTMTATGVDIIQLTAGQAYTITPAQAAFTRIGSTGTLGDVRSSGVITIKADTAAADLSTITGDSNDVVLLGSGLAYTLTSQQALRAKVVTAGVQGASGDLRTAGIITVVANTSGENLAATTVQGVDFYVLTAGSDYVLTSAQAKYSKVGSAGTLGALSTAGLVSIRGVAGEDFTNTITAAGITGCDVLLLGAGQAFTLTADQARIARIVDSVGNISRSAALTSTGVLTIKADSAGGDLTPLVTDNNDVLVLGAGLNYVLTAAQAITANVTTGSGSGLLTKTANLSVIAPSTGGDLSALVNVSGIQSLTLTAGQKYSLPTSLASVVQIGSSGTLGSFTNAGPLTATASVGEDLTVNPLALAASAILLTAGQNYKMTAAQAAMARFGSGNALGDLRQTGAAKPGTLTIDGTGASDLSGLLTDSNVSIVLTSGQNTTLTASQAFKTTVGSSTVAGDLSAAGVVTIKAPNGATPALDLSPIVVGVSDVLQLSGGGSYILSKAQVPLARVASGAPGNLSKAGVISVYAAPEDNLTSLASSSYSGIDNYLLTAGANYTLTNTQAAISKIGTAALGVLASTGVLTIVASPGGADLTGLGTDTNDVIQLTAGASYTLTPIQALTAQLVSSSANGPVYGSPGQLDSQGQITLRTPTGSAVTDLSTLGVSGIDAIVLNAGQPYILNAAQAAVAQVGSGGTRGDLSSTAVITILASGAQDLSGLKTDSNDVIQLDDATAYTLTTTQALTTRIGAAGKAGVLASTGVLRVLAPVGGDFTALGTDSNDKLVLWPAQRYTITTTQAANACVWNGTTDGPLGNLSTAGAVRLIASTVVKASEDLTGLLTDSSDIIQLTAGVNYTLTAAQAAIAQVGAAGKAGDLIGGTANAGNIVVKASGSADLSALKLDAAGDQIILTSVVGSTRCNYTLSPAQVGIAQVDAGVAGDFSAAGTVTIRASATGEDLSTGAVVTALGIDVYQLSPMQNYTLLASQVPLTRVGNAPTLGTDLTAAGVVNVKADIDNLSPLSSVKGVDAYILTPGASYTLTAAQALLAKIGPTGAAGVLTSSGKMSITAASAADLSPVVTDSGDAITLTAGLDYSLNPMQLGIASVYTAPVGSGSGVTSTAGDLRTAGVVTLRADSSADLSTLTALGVDAIALTVGRDYVMTTAQALMAKVGTGNSGILNKAGVVTLKPVAAGEDLATVLSGVTGYDVLQLNDASDYTLTAAQAAIARIGPMGTAGNLVSTGDLTITASSSASLSALQLDSDDTVLLSRGNFSYTLSAQQAGIARLTDGTTTALPGQLAHSSGVINVLAKATGEDLSGMIVSGLDAIILSPGQNYTLTTAQAPIAKVGLTGTLGNTSKANVTLTGINGTPNAELLVGGVRADTITGFGGNDTMTGGAGSDTFFLSGTAAVNGSDTITDFTPGVGGDVLKFSTFMTRLGTLTATTSLTPVSSASTTTATTGNVYVLKLSTTAIASKDYTGAQFPEIFGASAVLSTSTAAADIKDVLVVQGNDVTKIYYIDNTLDGDNATISASDVGLVVTMTGVTTSSTAFVTSNFV